MTVLRPLSDRLIVVPDPKDGDRLLDSGLILPGVTAEEKQIGTVTAVGPGRTESGVMVPLAVGVGDRVMYGKYAGTELELDGSAVLVLRESDVMFVVEDEG